MAQIGSALAAQQNYHVYDRGRKNPHACGLASSAI
jgi:hypothetical protein